VSKQREDGQQVIDQFNKVLKAARASGEMDLWVQDFYDKLAVENQ
jgi:ABC-type amino acid transport substrate-binding protein